MNSGSSDDDLAPLILDYFLSGDARQDREATMNFVRISDKRAINLDNVAEVRHTTSAGFNYDKTAVIVTYLGETEPLTVFENNDGYAALLAWMKAQPGINEEEWSDPDDAFILAANLTAKTNALLDTIYRKEE